jgi:1-deoxy-D-xylulose 5-phosphate reductoisomerase
VDNTWRLRRIRCVMEAQTRLLIRLVDAADEIPIQAFIKEQAAATRALESVSRHEQRLQNGTLKALKQLKDLQKEARLEQERSQKNKTQSGFVPAPEFKAAATSESAQNQASAPVVEAQKQAA